MWLEEMLCTTERPGKRELYFQAGAIEFWLCDQAGRMSFYGHSGQLARSALCPKFPENLL